MNKRRAWRRTRLLALLALSLSACNRAVPEKANSQTAQSQQPSQTDNPSTALTSAPVTGSSGEKEILPPGARSAAAVSAEPVAAEANNVGVAPAVTERLGPPSPGVQIENGPAVAQNGETPADSDTDQALSDRLFMKLVLPNAALAPDQLLAFLVECDRAVQDLAMTRQANQINEPKFLEHAKRLSGLKLQASERLFNDATASVAQKKTAIAAQVESLSQLTGLGDVEAAQKLLRVADGLTKSNDAQLAHQGRLVLMGFRLNQLVEGQIKDPQAILDDVNGILDKSEYRGLVELLALQQSLGVLNQLGYAEQARQLQQRIVKEFRNSPIQDLAMRSWMIEVGNSPELKTAFEAIQQTLAGQETDPTKVAQAAAAFVNAYPSLNTLAYFLSAIIDLEYKGRIPAARELSNVIAKAKAQLPPGPLLKDIDNVLDGHTRRLGALGQPLVLVNLTGMDGTPFDWNAYRNKVVLVYFWASWEVPSLNMIDQIKKLREQITDTDFEIVGICIDDGTTITDAEHYVSRQGLKWRNVRSSIPQAVGLETAAAKAVGVNAYSNFTLLVDKQGIVREVHLNFDTAPAKIRELSGAAVTSR